jgi:hypothetical protein
MAGRICDQLKARFGENSVYMDIDNIPVGIDFWEHINTALDQAEVLIAVVGPKWLGTRRNGRPRIMEDHDFVRTEVEVALQRGIRVVPVLVDGAAMPDRKDLPESMKSFTYRNAASVDAGVDFHQHVERLARSIEPFIEGEPWVEGFLRRFEWFRPLRVRLAAISTVGVISIAALWWPGWPGGSGGGAGGPIVVPPQPGQSLWVVDKSTVYLEPTGDKRQFFLIDPSLELISQGAQSGWLLFDGQKTDNMSYKGKLFVFAGRCGTRHYDASGPITNDDQTVTLVGLAPRIDPVTCLQIDEQERTLVFNFKRIISSTAKGR